MAEVPLFDVRMDILDRNAVEASPAKRVFTTVGTILTLVRDKMSDNKDCVQLSEYCFDVCEVLKIVTQGKNTDDLDQPVKVALVGLERVVCEIEGTLRRGVDGPHVEYNQGKVEDHKLEIQEILGNLNAPLNKSLVGGVLTPPSTPGDPQDDAETSVSENSYGRLIKRAFTPHELPSLIEATLSSEDEGDAIRRLLGDDAQAFIDVIDEALDRPDLSPQTRKKCLKLLYRTCGHHSLLPRTLKIPICYDRTSDALYRGGYADVWKGEYRGQDVAVKVLRTYSTSDLRKLVGRFCKEVVTWKALQHPNVLPLIGVTMSESRFAMVSDWMINGNINDFTKAHPEADRLELLGDATRGLIYIHGQEMIHGDLKGANILIDQTGHASLADFGLLTIVSDPTNLLSSSSYTQGGTLRWMSPERIAPQRFGFKDGRPTILSDCYALGMVIYETISGNLPFHKYADLVVFMKVVEGERPSRGDKFTRSLSWMLERCWAPNPNDRPNIEDVLLCLEMASSSPGPSSPMTDEGTDEDDEDDEDDDWGSPTGSSGDLHLTDSRHTPPEVRPSVSSWATLEHDDQYGPTLPTPNPELLFPPRDSTELSEHDDRYGPTLPTPNPALLFPSREP